MFKENKEGKCNCKYNEVLKTCKDEPLIIYFKDEGTGKLEKYEFLEEFKFNGEKIMAVALIDGSGMVEFATCEEDSDISEFICDPELENYFAILHENDGKYIVCEELVMTNENGEEEIFLLIDEFEVDGKQVYVICVEDTDDVLVIDFLKQEEGDNYYFVTEEKEAKNLMDIFLYILYKNEE